MTREADGGEGENRGSEEDEPLGDHADEAGNSAGDSNFGSGIWDIKSGPEEESADGDKGETDVFNNIVDEFKEFGIGSLDGVGTGFELVDEIVGADRGGFGFAGAGNNKTARDELVARVLSDVVLLASDEGFVDLDSSLLNLAVYNDLVAEGVDQ